LKPELWFQTFVLAVSIVTKLKRHFMFRLNFGLKQPVFGFKPRFETLVLTKDKVTQYGLSFQPQKYASLSL